MRSSQILILIAMPMLVWSFCDTKTNSITIYPSTQESYQWDLKNDFFIGPLLTHTIEPATSQFKIQKPIAMLSDPVRHVETASRVTQARAYTQTKQKAWLNQFVFIQQQSDVLEVFYAVASQADSNKAPGFNTRISVNLGTTQVTCFSVDYLDQDTFIVDCADQRERPFTNLFYIVPKKGDVKIVQNDNVNYYTTNTKRIMQTHTSTTKLGKEHKYLFRSTPAYATNYSGLDQQSIIEVFSVGSDNIPRATSSVLDAATLAFLIGIQDPQHFKFSLIDFQVQKSTGKIYVLDAFNGIFILKLQGNGEFQLVDRFLTGTDQTYGFDMNTLINEDGTGKHVLTVLFNDYLIVYEDSVYQNGYVLPFQASYPSSIQVTQEFIVILHKGVTYIYSTEHEELIYKETIDGPRVYLVNPYETEIVAITASESRRYTLSNGYMTFAMTNTKTASIKTFNLVATDPSKTTCQVTVNFRVLDAADFSIYDKEELDFPNLVVDSPNPFELSPLSSGPNLAYTFMDTADSDNATQIYSKIVSIWDIKITNRDPKKPVVLPNPSTVIYADILATDDSNKFYQLLQTSDKKVMILDCDSISKYDSTVKCEVEDQFQLNVVLSRLSFTWWTEFDQLYYLVVQSDYKMAIFTSDEGISKLVSEITYPTDTLNKITSVTALKDRFFVVLGNKKQIDIYAALSPFNKEYSITEVWIRTLGLQGNWFPKRVFGNRAHKSFLFFIVNDDSVVVADYHHEVALIKQIPCLAGAQIELAIAESSFFIVQKTSTANLIQEYDLVNLSVVQLIKAAPLYWYTLQTPLTADFCSDTGDLFVRAYDAKTQQTVILVYGPLTLSHESLLKVIPVGKKIDDGKSLVMASSGSSQMYLYINNGSEQKTVSYLKKAQIIVEPTFNNQSYYSQATIRFIISNYADSNTRLYYHKLSLVNTQSKLKVDQTLLDTIELKVKPKQFQYIPLGYNWFDGQAVSIDIDCEQCDEYINVKNSVDQVTYGAFNGYAMKDAAPFFDGRTLFQSDYKVTVASLEGKSELVFSINLSTNKSDKCEFVTATEDGTLVFSACYINGVPVIVASKCTFVDNVVECARLGEPTHMAQVNKFAKIRVVGKHLLILNSNPNNPKQFESSLNLYKINATDEQVTYTDLKQVGTNFINNGKLTYFSDFYVQKYVVSAKTYLKLYIVDATQGVFILDGSVDAQGVITYLATYEQINLYQYLNGEGYYATMATVFQQVSDTSDAVYSTITNTLTTTILVTTNNVAHYGLKLVYDTTSLNLGAKLKTKAVSFILNQYGDWVSLNKLSLYNGFAVIAYTNQAKTLLASYYLPVDNASVELVRMKGGLIGSFAYPQVNEFVMYVSQSSQLPQLYANIVKDDLINENLVVTYDLLTDFYLEVLNANSKVVTQYLRVLVSNSFTTAQGYAQVVTVESNETNISTEQPSVIEQYISRVKQAFKERGV